MIKLICVGKIKEQYLKDLINDYLKRINKYHKLDIIELKDSNKIDESKEILKYVNSKDYIITMDINGNKLSSVELSKKIDNLLMNYSNITFIIGGSYGLHDDVKSVSNYSLSFSDLTFPHGLFRGLLLEQIYRSFKILNNESYHK